MSNKYITIKDKKLELKDGILNVYYSKEFQNSFYSQFANSRIFGCNFNDGIRYGKEENDLSAFAFDFLALSFHQRLGYFNKCFNFDNKEVDVDIKYCTDGNVVTSYLLSKFLEYKFNTDHLIISNMYDTHLGSMEKIIYLKKLEELVYDGKYTVIMLTNDLTIFNLLGININLFVEDVTEVETINELVTNYQDTEQFYNILSKK